MNFILQRDEPDTSGHAVFVNKPGSEKSYTAVPHKARRFPSRDAAAAEACGNETPVCLEELLNL